MAIFYDNNTNTELNAINVKAYGAIGDGIADDTVAIQAAIDVAYNAGGGRVYFGDGNFLISASLIIGANVYLDM